MIDELKGRERNGVITLPSAKPQLGALLMIAGLLQAIRHMRWAGDRTLADRLVLVLHVAYAFVPIDFLLIGAATLWPSVWPKSAGIHAWTAGAVGLMTLAVMTRASFGHTGRPLAASLPTRLIYLCVLVAALTRIAAFVIFFGPLLVGHPLAWSAREPDQGENRHRRSFP